MSATKEVPGIFDELIARECEKIREEMRRTDPLTKALAEIAARPRLIPPLPPKPYPELAAPIIDRDPGDEHVPRITFVAVRKSIPVRA